MSTPAQAIAFLRGLADDYAMLLKELGKHTTSGIISGVSKEAADSLVLFLRTHPSVRPLAPQGDPEPQPIEIEN